MSSPGCVFAVAPPWWRLREVPSFHSKPLGDLERCELLTGGREVTAVLFEACGGRLVGLSLWGGRRTIWQKASVCPGSTGLWGVTSSAERALCREGWGCTWPREGREGPWSRVLGGLVRADTRRVTVSLRRQGGRRTAADRGGPALHWGLWALLGPALPAWPEGSKAPRAVGSSPAPPAARGTWV